MTGISSCRAARWESADAYAILRRRCGLAGAYFMPVLFHGIIAADRPNPIPAKKRDTSSQPGICVRCKRLKSSSKIPSALWSGWRRRQEEGFDRELLLYGRHSILACCASLFFKINKRIFSFLLIKLENIIKIFYFTKKIKENYINYFKNVQNFDNF